MASPRLDHASRPTARALRHRERKCLRPWCAETFRPRKPRACSTSTTSSSGSVRRQGNRITVNVELAEGRAARIVWVYEFACGVDDSPGIPEEIGNRIVASLAREVEVAERNRAMLRPPSSAECVGGVSPRPLAHVSLQQR